MMLYMFPGGQTQAERKTPIPVQSGTLRYNGSSQSPTWNGYDTSRMTMSGQTSGTNAGSYTVTFTIDPPYIWNDGTSGSKTVTWSIQKAYQSFTLSKTSVSLNTNSSTTVTASGYIGTLSASSDTSSIATVSVSGGTLTINSGTDGYATITVTASGNSNYYSANKYIDVEVASILKLYDGRNNEITEGKTYNLYVRAWDNLYSPTFDVLLFGNNWGYSPRPYDVNDRFLIISRIEGATSVSSVTTNVYFNGKWQEIDRARLDGWTYPVSAQKATNAPVTSKAYIYLMNMSTPPTVDNTSTSRNAWKSTYSNVDLRIKITLNTGDVRTVYIRMKADVYTS